MRQDIRLMRASDLAAVNDLLRQAYKNPANDYTGRLLRHLELQPDGWLVVERDGRVVATGGGTVMGPVGYIGLVGVDPALHRQGIGAALMDELIAFLRSQGCATILLDASDMGRPLYLKLGFAVDDTVSIWHADTAQSLLSAAPGAISVTPYAATDLTQIIAFDTAGFGAPRDRIVAAFLQDNPATTWISRDASDQLAGYLTYAPSHNFIGPWLASTPDSASALLHAALAQSGVQALTLHTPDANQAATRLLRGVGFTPVRTLAHMRMGPPLASTRRQMVYGQINLALG